ncbi:unnamed protein product [Heterobilharzia americana]|nr:unnamed protein product [Heterobilharzia americana]
MIGNGTFLSLPEINHNLHHNVSPENVSCSENRTFQLFDLWTVMDLANKAVDLEETMNSNVNHLEYVVRHLEDALVIRQRRKRCRKNNSSISVVQTSVSSPASTNEQWINKDNSWYSILPLTITHSTLRFQFNGTVILLARFLGQTTIFFGPQLLTDLLAGTHWYQSGNFPRVTFCDLDMRRMGSNYHRYTLQCVLGINMFNEKIFIFLWFWFTGITLMNVHSFLHWCCRSTFQTSRACFIRNLLFNKAQNAGDTKASDGTQHAECQSTGHQSSTRTTHSIPSDINQEQLSLADKKASAFFTELVNATSKYSRTTKKSIPSTERTQDVTPINATQVSDIVQTPPIPERMDKIRHAEGVNPSTSSFSESDRIIRVRAMNIANAAGEISQCSRTSQSQSTYSSGNFFNSHYDHCSHSDRNSSIIQASEF